MKIIEYRCKCQACNGSGIFVGFAEQNSNIGIVCHKCAGKGYQDIKWEYEDFRGKEIREGIDIVIETNPGIVLGKNFDVGGMSYRDWLDEKSFPEKSEMRKFCCPALWYQIIDYKKKPHWNECISMGSFSDCDSFAYKEKCWERFDKENKEK